MKIISDLIFFFTMMAEHQPTSPQARELPELDRDIQMWTARVIPVSTPQHQHSSRGGCTVGVRGGGGYFHLTKYTRIERKKFLSSRFLQNVIRGD